MYFQQIFDSSLAQYSYIIGCQRTGTAIVIDPLRDIDRYHTIAKDNDLKITSVADTHIHADYLTGAQEFIEDKNITAYLSSEGEPDWTYKWAKGRENVIFIKQGSEFSIGNIHFKVQRTAGHTPEHVAFFVTDGGGGATSPMGVLSGDFLFVGTLGRPDLLESAAGMQGLADSSARVLYESVQNFKKSGDELQVWPAHGAGSSCGKGLGAVPMSTIGYERKYNNALKTGISGTEQEFVDLILEGQPEPPLYWADMKRLNRDGIPILGGLPQPAHLSSDDFNKKRTTVTIVDARPERKDFFKTHISNSIFAPYDANMSQILGSLLPLDTELLLLLPKEVAIEQVVRELVRVGFDNYAGWAYASDILPLSENQGQTSSIISLSPEDGNKLLAETTNAQLLDVRGAVEFAESSSVEKKNSINIAHTRLLARYDEIPRDKTLHVRCASGHRASIAVAFLASKGHKVIHHEG